ncbi:MarR family winged helix-turn-helix transcriptional regulator [Lacunimicrobium album]
MSTGRLQQELKKRQPFELLEQEACLNLFRTSDLLQNRMGKFMREFGLTPSQYNILRILRGEGKPLPSLEIASRMIQVVPAITGLVDRLEAQNLVVRKRCNEDRRVVFIDITPAGLELLAKIDQPLYEAHKQVLSMLSEDEMRTLSRLLEKIRSEGV